jgi:hypothetical protein
MCVAAGIACIAEFDYQTPAAEFDTSIIIEELNLIPV